MLKYMLKDKRTNQEVFMQRLVDFDLASDGQKTDYIFYNKLDKAVFEDNKNTVLKYCCVDFAKFCHLFGFKLVKHSVISGSHFDSLSDIANFYISMTFKVDNKDIVNYPNSYRKYIDDCMCYGVSQYFNLENITNVIAIPFIETLVENLDRLGILWALYLDNDSILNYMNESGVLKQYPSLYEAGIIDEYGKADYKSISDIPKCVIEPILHEPDSKQQIAKWSLFRELNNNYSFGGTVTLVDKETLEITFKFI